MSKEQELKEMYIEVLKELSPIILPHELDELTSELIKAKEIAFTMNKEADVAFLKDSLAFFMALNYILEKQLKKHVSLFNKHLSERTLN